MTRPSTRLEVNVTAAATPPTTGRRAPVRLSETVNRATAATVASTPVRRAPIKAITAGVQREYANGRTPPNHRRSTGVNG